MSEQSEPIEPDVTPKARKRPGPRPYLNAQRQAEVCAIVGVGCSLTTAAKYLGCTLQTIQRTRNREPEFAAALLRADSHGELALVRRIHDAAAEKNGWRAAAWLLTRRHPERYAARAANTTTPHQVDQTMYFFAKRVVQEIASPDDRKRVKLRLKKFQKEYVDQLRLETEE
ncbi:MAG: hypothetical protein C0483_20480 [Pirellula sp.]|nr:hypothetical protein [Pirellula sp.]